MQSSGLLAKDLERKNLLYQAYTTYIQPSSIITNHYLNKDYYLGQQKYLQKLTKWIEKDEEVNKPLVLRTEAGVGVKTLLVNWQRQMKVQNQSKKQKTLFIIHFASSGSNCSNYFYALYQIIIKIRQSLKLKQNVDLLQEKIRKYFAYWLDLSNSEIQRQLVIYCAQQIYEKIVIIIEGVDKFLDAESGREANIAFWLPEMFPKNIKVVVTADKHSQAIEHLQKIKCEIIDLQPCPEIAENLLKKALRKQTIYNKDTENKLMTILKKLHQKPQIEGIYNLIEIYSNCLLFSKENKTKQIISVLKDIVEKKLNLQTLNQISNIEDLYLFLLKIWSEYLPLKGKIEPTLKYLCLSQKGLTAKQLMSLSHMNQKEWTCFETAVQGILINHKSLYSIKSTSFSNFILSRFKSDAQAHQNIAGVLELTPNSIRKLQEQTYHLFVANSYFKLKETISNIQNFLLLFNPNNKYELSRYWQKLQEKGFDPVIQYNKAVEGFSMHYHPSDQNIFRIIVQISRFLKQFCDFETYQTPVFRHPYIEGNKTQLQKIGLLKELSNLKIHIDSSFAEFDSLEEQGNEQVIEDELTLEQQISQLRQKQFPKEQLAVETTQSPLSPVQTKKRRRKTPLKILSDIQQLNVDVPMNREKFRRYYLESLNEFMKKQQTGNEENEQIFFDVDEGTPQSPTRLNPNYSYKKIKQNYKLRQVKPTLYYYKRWIWIQFPWVCISLHNNYSTTPQLCCQKLLADEDTFEQQARYTKQALIVAIDAKQRKKQMFSPKGQQNQHRPSRFKCTFSSSLCKNSKFKTNFTANRSQSKFTLIADLSLNALTKQLENRRKSFKVTDEDIFGSQENGGKCEEDMKFITMRKQFQPPNIEGVPASQLLPKLKWVIKDHTNYEMDYIKMHIQQKKKKLNKIIYENRKLAQTYKELKLKETINKKSHNEQQGQKNVRKNKALEELQHKKQEVITNFCKSLLQKQRLKIILKLCSDNKTRNQQYLSSLNYLLQNIKKMITWEKQNMKAVTEELEEIKLLKDRKNAIEAQKDKNQQIVQNEAKNYLAQKNKLEEQIQNITMIIAQDIRDQKDKLQICLTGHIKSRQQKNFAMAQQKKNKQLQQKLERVEKDYRAVQSLFEFEGFDFENAPKFRRLLEENQRNKKLKIAYFQRKNKLQKVMRQHQKLKEEYKKQPSLLQKNEPQPVIIKKLKTQSEVDHENKIKILLENISIKLGVKSKQEIIPAIQSKLQLMKETRKDLYVQIMDPEYHPPLQKFQLIQ